MSDSTPLTHFGIANGEWRGTDLTLHPAYIVHRGESHHEMLPLAGLASVCVSFERDASRIRWGIALVIFALALFAIAGPLESLAGSAGREMAAQQAGGGTGVASALLGFFKLIEGLAKALPLIAGATVLGGVALCALGFFGTTTLTLTFAGGERVYSVRGRDALLRDFSERVSEAVAALHR